MSLFQFGDFTLASGAKSAWKIECDALTSEDWQALAAMLVERLPPFGAVHGVPRGGLPLERALTPYITPGKLPLVCDDVWTTGGSVRRFIAKKELNRDDVIITVVFARNPVPCWVVPLFQMTPERKR